MSRGVQLSSVARAPGGKVKVGHIASEPRLGGVAAGSRMVRSAARVGVSARPCALIVTWPDRTVSVTAYVDAGGGGVLVAAIPKPAAINNIAADSSATLHVTSPADRGTTLLIEVPVEGQDSLGAPER